MTEQAPKHDATVEALAALVHDAWIGHRRRTGWTFGSERNDEERTSPSLVPYERLSEAERELDRVSVRATLDACTPLTYKRSVAPS